MDTLKGIAFWIGIVWTIGACAHYMVIPFQNSARQECAQYIGKPSHPIKCHDYLPGGSRFDRNVGFWAHDPIANP